MSSYEEVHAFCCRLLDGGYPRIHNTIREYQELYTTINVNMFTKDNFDKLFQSICTDVFARRDYSKPYVIALLGFAIHINRRLEQSCMWYTRDLLVRVVTDVLVAINFKPCKVVSRCSTFYYLCCIL